jgi:hypothetical protein
MYEGMTDWMEKLTLGELNQMDYETGSKRLKELGYRLTAYNSNEKAGRVVIQAKFRSSEGAVHFHHEYKEKRNGRRVNETQAWSFSAI